jgi:hypothetical protein
VHAGRFAGNFRSAAERTSDRRRKFFAISPLIPFHDDRPTSLGFLPELSYTIIAAAQHRHAAFQSFQPFNRFAPFKPFTLAARRIWSTRPNVSALGKALVVE